MTKEQIDLEQKILEELWKQSSELQNKISKQREKLKKMTGEYNSNRELTLAEIFQYDYLESTYKFYKMWCEENGFMSGGYFPDTEQYAIKLCFDLDDKKKVKKQKFNLNKYLEIAKPKEDGLVWISVFENSLSAGGCYHIVWDKDKGFRCHHTYRKFITDYMKKDEMFEWGLKNIPYGGDRDD